MEIKINQIAMFKRGITPMKKILFFTLFIFTIQSLSANSISVQGVLRDNNNRAVEDGQYEMKFQIFDSETNGSSIVGEQTFTVSVKNGVYDVQLPVANALVTSTDQLWLKVTVAGETMGNRVRLHLPPVEMHVNLNDENIIGATGCVGIGTTAPHEDAKLDVNGEVRIANQDQLPSYNASGSTLFPSKLFLANPVYGPAIWSEMINGRYQDGVDFHIGVTNTNNAHYKSYFSIFGQGGRIGMGRGDVPGTMGSSTTGAYNFNTPNSGYMYVNIADRWGFGSNGYWNNIFVRSHHPDMARVYFLGESTADAGFSTLDVGVHAGSFGEFDNTSARENARTISYGLNTIMSLAPKEFNYVQSPERNHVGFIAEEVEAILPEVISRPMQENDPYSISYTRFTPVLTKAIQELKTEKDAEIKALENQNSQLQETLNNLIQRIETLENE